MGTCLLGVKKTSAYVHRTAFDLVSASSSARIPLIISNPDDPPSIVTTVNEEFFLRHHFLLFFSQQFSAFFMQVELMAYHTEVFQQNRCGIAYVIMCQCIMRAKDWRPASNMGGEIFVINPPRALISQ